MTFRIDRSFIDIYNGQMILYFRKTKAVSSLFIFCNIRIFCIIITYDFYVDKGVVSEYFYFLGRKNTCTYLFLFRINDIVKCETFQFTRV